MRVFFLTLALLVVAAGNGAAQPDGSPVLPGSRDTDRDQIHKSARDQLEKLRIAKQKKDFQNMLERGEQALSLSEQLESKLETSAQFTAEDFAKLDSLEKIVKKIRSELGGSDDGADDVTANQATAEDEASVKAPSSLVDALRTLKNQTVKLVGELKKTTRFSISAAAIRASNVVINLTKYLRLHR